MRFLKNLFSVPKGKKVTDADMKRVLVSSVCGILVCMTCLISSTWAWYTVSAETGAFTIQVVDAELSLTVNGNAVSETSVELIPAVEVEVQVDFSPAQTADALTVKPQRYVVMTVLNDQEQPVGTYYVACNPSNDRETNKITVKLVTDVACKVYFTPAWQIPLNGKEYASENFKLIEAPEETTATTTAATTEAATETTAAPTTAVTAPVTTPTENEVPVATTVPANTENAVN